MTSIPIPETLKRLNISNILYIKHQSVKIRIKFGPEMLAFLPFSDNTLVQV